MTYEAALTRAWQKLEEVAEGDRWSVSLLRDTYEISLKDKVIFSNSYNAPTKDYLTILLLHYLTGSLKQAYSPSGQWVSFKDIEGGEIYYPAFRESVIKPLLRKYGARPQDLLNALNRLNGKEIKEGDIGIEITAFPQINVRILLWKGDEEFGPEATILFDKNITRIYTMEDLVVFSRFITHNVL